MTHTCVQSDKILYNYGKQRFHVKFTQVKDEERQRQPSATISEMCECHARSKLSERRLTKHAGWCAKSN